MAINVKKLVNRIALVVKWFANIHVIVKFNVKNYATKDVYNAKIIVK